MAAYFQLISKVTGEPTAFQVIDEELCKEFDEPCHETKYLWDWYLAIGMRVALGKTLVDIATELHNIAEECDDYFSLQLCKVALYLDKHYDTNNWAGR